MLSARLIFRCFHTSLIAQSRHRRINDDPGVKRRMKVFDADDEYRNEIEEDDDISGLESDFHNVDLMYKEHKREIFKNRQFQGNKITVKKFFSGPPPPNMLTWAERIQIQDLHKKDPEEWGLDALAESFPASRATISKVLKQKWKPENITKMKQKDKIVHENWQLLAENKLDAEPELLEHLRKFLPRREEFLQSIQNNEIEFLERPEPKKIWNNGQMSRILESYDNSLRILDEKQKFKQNLIESKDDRQILAERINYEASQLEDLDSFKLDSATRPSKLTTLPELKKDLASNEKKNLLDKVIIESDITNVGSAQSTLEVKNNLGQKKNENILEQVIGSKEVTGTHINERLANLAGYSLQGKFTTRQDKKKTHFENSSRTEIFETVSDEDTIWETQSEEPFQKMSNEFSSHRNKKETSHSRFSDMPGNSLNNNSRTTNEEIQKSSSYDSREEFTEKNVNHMIEENGSMQTDQYLNNNSLNLIENKKPKEVIHKQTRNRGNSFSMMMEDLEENRQVTELSTKTENEEIKTYDFPSELDKTEFEKEEKSISQTFFWDSNDNKGQETSITNLDVNELKAESVNRQDYAERIKIPKDKRGSGLTFRVKDCYYDDDGEFLYRVPGMTKTEGNETVS